MRRSTRRERTSEVARPRSIAARSPMTRSRRRCATFSATAVKGSDARLGQEALAERLDLVPLDRERDVGDRRRERGAERRERRQDELEDEPTARARRG